MEFFGLSVFILVLGLSLGLVFSFPTTSSITNLDSAPSNPQNNVSPYMAPARPCHLDMSQCLLSTGNQATFHLYTKSNPEGYELKDDDLTNLRNSKFLVQKKVKVLVHGFTQTVHDEFPKALKDAYLKTGEDVNVIIVNWSIAANPITGYDRAVECTREVGQKISRLLKSLIKEKLTSPDKIHIVGNSLGAHTSGMAGKEFRGTLGRVTGLDPAYPCFDKDSAGYAYRLNKTDAVFVDVIHTDGQTKGYDALGMSDMIGHVDFFLNGGKKYQPGCLPTLLHLDPCSHHRAPKSFLESVENPKAFIGRECESYTEFLKGDCNSRSTMVMGDATPSSPTMENGFHLKTSSSSPFGRGINGSIS